MSEELKKCPFCGTIPTLLTREDNVFSYFNIFCKYKYCIAKPDTGWCSDNNYTLEGFIELWNTRAESKNEPTN